MRYEGLIVVADCDGGETKFQVLDYNWNRKRGTHEQVRVAAAMQCHVLTKSGLKVLRVEFVPLVAAALDEAFG